MKLNFQSRNYRCAALSIICSGKAMQNVASRHIEVACGDEIKMVERQRIITDFWRNMTTERLNIQITIKGATDTHDVCRINVKLSSEGCDENWGFVLKYLLRRIQRAM